MISDPRFWAKDLRRKVAADVRRLREAVERKIMPAFSKLAEEADALQADTYDRLGRSSNPDFEDAFARAEQARDEAIEYYVGMKGIEQAVMNMLAAALYHLLEQQLLEFHRLEFLKGPPVKGNRRLDDLYSSLRAEGINVKGFQSYPKIGELRLVANTVKHGERKASRTLHKLRPDLFVPPGDRSHPQATDYASPVVYVPLLGEQFYVNRDDLADYFDAVERYLNKLANAIEATAKPLPQNSVDDPLG